MSEPQGEWEWTDDMSVQLPANRSVKEVAAFVIQQALQDTPDEKTESLLVSSFGIDPDDAAFIRDRVFGGIVRAATGNKSNQPDAKKDPFAHASFDLVRQDSSIITSIYPQFEQLAKRPWWKFW
jgi:hypothetical protein